MKREISLQNHIDIWKIEDSMPKNLNFRLNGSIPRYTWFTKLKHKEIGNTNSSITTKGIEAVIKHLPQ